MKYKILEHSSKLSQSTECWDTYDNLNKAYCKIDEYNIRPELTDYTYSVIEVPSIIFAGPFCMHCKSNQHLGIECDSENVKALW